MGAFVKFPRLWLYLGVGLFAAGCACGTSGPDGGDPELPFDPGPFNGPPTVLALSPASQPAGAAAQPLTLTGTNFLDGMQALWNGAVRPLTRVSATEAKLALTTEDLAVPRTHRLRALNPGPGGAGSDELLFAVTGLNPVPRIDQLGPNATRAGSAGFTLQVSGGNFTPSSVVRWNGTDRTTTFVNSIGLTAPISAPDVAVAGPASVTVFTPAPGGGTSAAANFTIQGTSGALIRVSLAEDGGELSTGARDFILSPDGRFVAFMTGDPGVVAGDTNGFSDVFLRDTCVGAAAGCQPSTRRVSLAADGGQLVRPTTVHGISSGGRFVLLRSDSVDLFPGYGGVDLTFVVRDTCLGAGGGCVPDNIPVAVQVDGGVANSGEPYDAVLSPDGRFVAFIFDSPDLVADDTNGRDDVFVRDTCLGAGVGCVPGTELASLHEDGGQLTFGVSALAMSDDGRFVAFVTNDDTVTASDVSPGPDVFLRDTCRGASTCTPTTVKVSLGPNGEASAPWNSIGASMSANGRYVTFMSRGTLGFSDGNNAYDAFVRDTCAAMTSCAPTTQLISQAPDGGTGALGSSVNGSHVVSASGRYVAFLSDANNLVSQDSANADAFVRDTCFGAAVSCTPSTVLVSRAPGGAAANSGVEPRGPALSADGRYLVFSSTATNLVADDTNNVFDVFLVSTGF